MLEDFSLVLLRKTGLSGAGWGDKSLTEASASNKSTLGYSDCFAKINVNSIIVYFVAGRIV